MKNKFTDTRKFINPLKRRKSFNKKLAVFDIETYLDNKKKHIPYAIGYKVGNVCKLFFLSNYGRNVNISVEKMLVKEMAQMWNDDLSPVMIKFNDKYGIESDMIFSK